MFLRQYISIGTSLSEKTKPAVISIFCCSEARVRNAFFTILCEFIFHFSLHLGIDGYNWDMRHGKIRKLDFRDLEIQVSYSVAEFS